MEEEVGAKEICEKETSLISQLFKTFTLDLEIVNSFKMLRKTFQGISLWFISKDSQFPIYPEFLQICLAPTPLDLPMAFDTTAVNPPKNQTNKQNYVINLPLY